MERRKACALTETGLDLCWPLDEIVESAGGKGTHYQGVKIYSMVDLDTFKPTRTLVVIKSGVHSKKGLTARFCPYCGTKILAEADPPMRIPAHADSHDLPEGAIAKVTK